MEMKLYKCHKEVLARPMTRQEYNDYRGWVLPEGENGDDLGYLVEYTDGGKSNHPDHKGYISWSPAQVFHNGYNQIEKHSMSFGTVIEVLKCGRLVSRSGWGKREYLKMNKPHDHSRMNAPYIYKHSQDGKKEPWVPSQSDMMAHDWWSVTEGV